LTDDILTTLIDVWNGHQVQLEIAWTPMKRYPVAQCALFFGWFSGEQRLWS
jgi:hypothetical protein